MSTNREIFDPKPQNATVDLTFDFISEIGDAFDGIVSAVVDVSVYSGDDSNPDFIKVGSPTAFTSRVVQRVIGGLTGIVYLLECQATTLSGRILVKTAYLLIIQ